MYSYGLEWFHCIKKKKKKKIIFNTIFFIKKKTQKSLQNIIEKNKIVMQNTKILYSFDSNNLKFSNINKKNLYTVLF